MVLAVRPEKMQLLNGVRPESCNAVQACLAAQIAHRIAVAPLNDRIGGRASFSPGSEQRIVWPVESGILLTS